jgi:hypothetical protein
MTMTGSDNGDGGDVALSASLKGVTYVSNKDNLTR